jgi:hypothetical protein
MKPLDRVLALAGLFGIIHGTCCAGVVQGMTKARAEAELGVVIRRESTGAEDAGIAIEFAPTNKLAGFLFVEMDIYFEIQAPGEQVRNPRRLTSATLQPNVGTKEQLRVFFTVNPQYLDRTAITIRVDRSVSAGPDGYMIWLDPKDFSSPHATYTTAAADPIVVRLKNAPLSLVLQTLSDAAGYVINSELGTGAASTRIRSNTLTLSKDSMGKQELADLLISTLFRAGVVWKIDGGRIVTLTPMAEAQSADPAIGISNPNRTGSGATTNQVGDYFSLVGIIDYKQGLMPGLAGTKAFFNGNKPEFVRGIKMSDTIARVYKVTKIDSAAGTATLTSTAGNVEMKVGTRMRWSASGSWDGPFEGTGAN